MPGPAAAAPPAVRSTKALAIAFAIVGICANGLLGLELRSAPHAPWPASLVRIDVAATASGAPEAQEVSQLGESVLHDAYVAAGRLFLLAAAAATALALLLGLNVGPRWLPIVGLSLAAVLPIAAVVRLTHDLGAYATFVQEMDPSLHPPSTLPRLLTLGAVCGGNLLAAAGFTVTALAQRAPSAPA
jgi:hypothetical protein